MPGDAGDHEIQRPDAGRGATATSGRNIPGIDEWRRLERPGTPEYAMGIMVGGRKRK